MKEKKMIVLNPLIEKLLDGNTYQALLDRLKDLGFSFVRDPSPGIVKVREEYKKLVEKASQFPVIDARCPYVINMIYREFPNLENLLAPVDPILITGAEIRRNESNEDNIMLYVVAPCKGFEKYATPDRTVHTWRDLKTEIHFYPSQKLPESSPVPIGFFGGLGVKVYSASGEENCRKLLTNCPKDAELLELLFCEGGCHKGDGL